jgi:hypothetical protein
VRREAPQRKAKRKLELVYVDPKRLKLWKGNPRKNDRAADQLAKLIEEHGFISPIIATRNGTVRAGNTRLKAALKKNLPEVPVIYVEFDSEEAAQAYSLSDNRASENAQWDQDLLRELFGTLERVEIDVDKTGFTQTEIKKLQKKRATFSEAVKSFTMTEGMTGLWCWMEVPEEDAALFQEMLDKYGSKVKEKAKGHSNKRRLSWPKVRRALLG